MKKIFIILFLTLSLFARATIYYVAPTASGGNDSNSGTIGSPWFTLNKAWAAPVVAGDIIYMRGGIYNYTTWQNLRYINGTAGNTIKIFAYPGESPVLDFTNSADYFGVFLRGVDYIYIKGIRITNVIQPDPPINGNGIYGLMLWDDVNHSVFELIETDHIGGWGVVIQDNCSDILFLNCDSHHNQDPYSTNPYGGADGFECGSYGLSGTPATGITFRGCRAWSNSDDGWDLRMADGVFTLENCWTFWNGYIPGTNTPAGNGEGFKLGSSGLTYRYDTRRFVKNCLTFENLLTGIEDSPDDGGYTPVEIYNTVSYKNGEGMNFNYTTPSILRNCVTYDNTGDDYRVGSSCTHDHNNFDITIPTTDADFVSVNSVGMDGSRQSNGNLPVKTFLHLVSGSDLRGAGLAVTGLTTDGDGQTWNDPPDLGVFRYVTGNTILTITGQTYTNTNPTTWTGYNVARNDPTTFTFSNNSITSQNDDGYMLQAGDEATGATNNNLDGAVITGNKFLWQGTTHASLHNMMVGYNINDVIKYNYIEGGTYGVVFKSGNGSTNMTYTAGGLAYNIFKNCEVAVRIKGVNGVPIYNNTFYDNDHNTNANALLYIGPYSGGGTGTKIKNNIFYVTNHVASIYLETGAEVGFESDYNVFYCGTGGVTFYYQGAGKTFAEWQALGYDIHSIVVNPNFINTTTFVPTTRLNYGTDLGATWLSGLSTNASWSVGVTPTTTNQNGSWQAGARVYSGGTTYYVSYSGNDSNDGTSTSTSWRTVNKINTTNFPAGTSILFNRGDVWTESLVTTSSGSSSNIITYGTYGTGNKPIITARDVIPSSNISGSWTNLGSNIWRMSLTPNFSSDWMFGRFWFNDVEKFASQTSTVTSTTPWFWDINTNLFYVYSVGNPSSTNIKGPHTREYAMTCSHAYVTINNLDLQGGRASLLLTGSANHIIVDGCDVGRYSCITGLWVAPDAGSSLEIKNSNIDTGCELLYTWNHPISYEGIILRGNFTSLLIHNCVFRNWAHASIGLSYENGTPSVENLKIYENYFTCPNLIYGRALNLQTPTGVGTGMEVYKNTFFDHPTQIQINVNGLKFYNNIVDGVRFVTSLNPRGHEGLNFAGDSVAGGAYDPRNVKVYHNVFANTRDAGIGIRNGASDKTGIELINNIFYECLGDLSYGWHASLMIDNGTEIHNNVYKNNLFYRTGYTSIIMYSPIQVDTHYTVSEFNSFNGTRGDVMTNNINGTGQPMFVNAANHDFHLVANSYAIGKGISITGLDYDKDGIAYASTRSVGPYEYMSSITVPTVVTADVTLSTNSDGWGGGNITSSGGATVTQAGIYWATTAEEPWPGGESGGYSIDYYPPSNVNNPYTSYFTGLQPNTTYYLRAYAINSVGTGLGDQISFTIPSLSIIRSAKLMGKFVKLSRASVKILY